MDRMAYADRPRRRTEGRAPRRAAAPDATRSEPLGSIGARALGRRPIGWRVTHQPGDSAGGLLTSAGLFRPRACRWWQPRQRGSGGTPPAAGGGEDGPTAPPLYFYPIVARIPCPCLCRQCRLSPCRFGLLHMRLPIHGTSPGPSRPNGLIRHSPPWRASRHQLPPAVITLAANRVVGLRVLACPSHRRRWSFLALFRRAAVESGAPFDGRPSVFARSSHRRSRPLPDHASSAAGSRLPNDPASPAAKRRAVPGGAAASLGEAAIVSTRRVVATSAPHWKGVVVCPSRTRC